MIRSYASRLFGELSSRYFSSVHARRFLLRARANELLDYDDEAPDTASCPVCEESMHKYMLFYISTYSLMCSFRSCKRKDSFLRTRNLFGSVLNRLFKTDNLNDIRRLCLGHSKLSNGA